ncbi:MAG: M48 family metalloprotease [Acidobacteria bacterium]|nr:M48 family metalloprotease [Acidobacteriota bacterium]
MQITVILAIFMALLVGETVASQDVPSWLAPRGVGECLAFLVGSLLLAASLFRILVRSALVRLRRSDRPTAGGLRLPGRIDALLRLMILLVYASQLTRAGWAWLIYVRWNLNRFILVDELLLLLPFVLLMLLYWYCYYPVNRHVREQIMMGQLVEGLATRPVWSRRQYILFQLRGGLLILLAPIVLILGFRDLVDLVRIRWLPQTNWVMLASELVVLLGVAVIFILAPCLLRYIWLTRSLPGGPLRRRLEGFCRRMRLTCRDILLWDTYSAVANAAVMGIFSRIRFVLLSDALIENMRDEEIEAVFGHEAGHVRHHHILYLVLFVLGSGSLVVLASEGFAWQLQQVWPAGPAWDRYGQWAVSGWFIGMLILWILLFGWVSRRFERQADLHGALMVDRSGVRLNDDDPAGPDTGDSVRSDVRPDPMAEDLSGETETRAHSARTYALGVIGARIFGTALMRIALLNGLSPDAHSWRHGSIRHRVLFLQELADRPARLRGFRRRMALLKGLILVAAAVGLAGSVWFYYRFGG